MSLISGKSQTGYGKFGVAESGRIHCHECGKDLGGLGMLKKGSSFGLSCQKVISWDGNPCNTFNVPSTMSGWGKAGQSSEALEYGALLITEAKELASGVPNSCVSCYQPDTHEDMKECDTCKEWRHTSCACCDP